MSSSVSSLHFFSFLGTLNDFSSKARSYADDLGLKVSTLVAPYFEAQATIASNLIENRWKFVTLAIVVAAALIGARHLVTHFPPKKPPAVETKKPPADPENPVDATPLDSSNTTASGISFEGVEISDQVETTSVSPRKWFEITSFDSLFQRYPQFVPLYKRMIALFDDLRTNEKWLPYKGSAFRGAFSGSVVVVGLHSLYHSSDIVLPIFITSVVLAIFDYFANNTEFLKNQSIAFKMRELFP